MLTNALRILVNNPIKESFYEKKKLMFWQFYSFPMKVLSKISQNGMLINALRALVSNSHR